MEFSASGCVISQEFVSTMHNFLDAFFPLPSSCFIWHFDKRATNAVRYTRPRQLRLDPGACQNSGFRESISEECTRWYIAQPPISCNDLLRRKAVAVVSE